MRGKLILLGVSVSSARSGSLAITTAQAAPLPTSTAVESAEVVLEIGVSSSHLPQPPADSSAAGVGNPEQNSCLHMDMSLFARGFSCGPPLSKPCFDFGRCGETPSVYVYDSGCSLLDSSVLLARDGSEEQEGTRMNHHYLEWIVRKEAKEAGLLAERNARPGVADSYAMEAASNMHSCFYRSGYDISISLAPEKVFQGLASLAPWERSFFLTTKGTVYLSGHGSEDRMSLVPLNDEEAGVITSMHCFEIHGEHLLPENLRYCQSLKDRYDDHDYDGLMNTTFGLVPAGRSPGTYRLGEVMSAGAIPVFVGRDMVPPFRERFDWPSFSFSFAPDEVGTEMIATLRAVSRAELEDMQRKSLEAYRGMFGTEANDFGPSARILFDILRGRLEHHGGR